MEEVKDYLEKSEKEIKEKEEKKSWYDRLIKDTYMVKGVPIEHIRKCPDNFITFLEYHPKYAGKFMYNEYSDTREFNGEDFDDEIEDVIFNDTIRYLGIQSRELLTSAISEVYRNHRYNPVVNYLKSLKWDGKKRIERLFINLLEADDTDLNRAMTRKWMIAAVKRCLKPGSKFDPMIVLQGSGGIGKSTICERLSKGFYSTISLDEIDNVSDLDTICFMGTNVISGSAKCAVIKTADSTYFGKVAKNITNNQSKSAFQKGIENISKLLIKFMFILTPIVFILNAWKHSPVTAFTFAVAIAICITPLLLPVILSTSLSKGAVKMSKKKTIVKKLDSIQSFGAMNILCTDKTRYFNRR